MVNNHGRPESKKHPHSIPPRQCRLKSEKKASAIHCRADSGPHFDDICILDNCNAKRFISTFGLNYINDT
jgi:hypothetical protein